MEGPDTPESVQRRTRQGLRHSLDIGPSLFLVVSLTKCECWASGEAQSLKVCNNTALPKAEVYGLGLLSGN